MVQQFRCIDAQFKAMRGYMRCNHNPKQGITMVKKKQLVLILTEPTTGNEDEYNDYYNNLHLDEVLETTDLQTAQRFKLVGQAGEPCPLPYLAVYETEAEHAEDVLANLNENRAQRQQSGALNKRTGRVWVFEEISPKHEK